MFFTYQFRIAGGQPPLDSTIVEVDYEKMNKGKGFKGFSPSSDGDGPKLLS